MEEGMSSLAGMLVYHLGIQDGTEGQSSAGDKTGKACDKQPEGLL